MAKAVFQGRDPGNALERDYQRGLDRLKQGWAAELWVCRRLMQLEADADVRGVLRALFLALIRFGKNGKEPDVKLAIAAVVATGQLLPVAGDWLLPG